MINVDKLFVRMGNAPIRAIDKKPRNAMKVEFTDSELRDAKLAQRVVLAQLDITAAKWNSQLAIGYWELRRMFDATRGRR